MKKQKKSIKDEVAGIFEGKLVCIKIFDMHFTPYRTTYSPFAQINFQNKANILRRRVDLLETCVKHGGRL
jgi:hypothetical protein